MASPASSEDWGISDLEFFLQAGLFMSWLTNYVDGLSNIKGLKMSLNDHLHLVLLGMVKSDMLNSE